jgi:hypothetical protein
MEPFKRARSPEEMRRQVAEAGREQQPCMLCGAASAPHVRDLTLIREDGAQLVIVARFCARCHGRPDRAQRTQAALQRQLGVDLPSPTRRPRSGPRN